MEYALYWCNLSVTKYASEYFEKSKTGDLWTKMFIMRNKVEKGHTFLYGFLKNVDKGETEKCHWSWEGII